MRTLQLFFLLFLSTACALKVLVYSPIFALSHSNFLGHIADILTDAGHDVTFMVPIADMSRRHQALHGVKTTKNIVVVEADDEMLKHDVKIEVDHSQFWTTNHSPEEMGKSCEWFEHMLKLTCENLYRNTAVIEQLKAEHFDIAVVEPLHVCGIGLFSHLGIEKTILATSSVFYDAVLPIVGEPVHNSYVPSFAGQKGAEMDVWERHTNLKYFEQFHNQMQAIFDIEMGVYQKANSSIPNWRELLPRASFMFTNSNSFLDFPRPILQKTIFVGGITVNVTKIRAQKLSEEWDEVLSRRPKSVLVSFGSMIFSSHMPIESKNNLLNVFKSMPDVTFIWKYETNETDWASEASNIHFSKWVPQTALLADSRLSAFMTHGGLGSVNELAHCGKPAVTVPIFGDQVRNAYMLARHDGSIVMSKFDLSNEKIVRDAIDAILNDERYRKNAEKLAEMLNNPPQKPRDLVLQYTEFAAKFGPLPKLDPHGRKLNFIQFHLLDVYAIIYAPYLIATVIAVSIVYFLFSKVLFKSSRKDKTQ